MSQSAPTPGVTGGVFDGFLGRPIGNRNAAGYLWPRTAAYFDRFFGDRPSSFSATSAARFPLKSIAPNVGPIRGRPYVEQTAMPATMTPGYAIPVCSTTASSDFSIHMPPSPLLFASPRFSRDWTTD